MAFFPAESVIKMFFTRSEFVTKLGKKKVQNIQVTRQFIFRFDLILCFNECWNLAEVTRKDTSWRFLARRPSSRIWAHDFFLWSLNWLGQKMGFFFYFPNLVASPKNSSFLLSGLRAEALKGRFNTLITYLKLVIQLCQLWMGTTKQDIFLSTQTLPAPQRKTSTGWWSQLQI